MTIDHIKVSMILLSRTQNMKMNLKSTANKLDKCDSHSNDDNSDRN
jgi:hypothetical protein